MRLQHLLEANELYSHEIKCYNFFFTAYSTDAIFKKCQMKQKRSMKLKKAYKHVLWYNIKARSESDVL